MQNLSGFFDFLTAHPELTITLILLLLFTAIVFLVWEAAKSEKDEFLYKLLDYHIKPMHDKINNNYKIESRFKIYVDIEIDTKYRQMYVCPTTQKWPDHVLDISKEPGGLFSYIKEIRQPFWLSKEEFSKRDDLKRRFTTEQLERFQHLFYACFMPIWLSSIDGGKSEDNCIRGMLVFYSRTESIELADDARKYIISEMTNTCELLSILLDLHIPRKCVRSAYAEFIKKKLKSLLRKRKQK